MTTMFRHSALLTAFLALAAAASPLGSANADPTATGGPAVMTIGANESSTSRRLDLTRGRSIIVDLPRDAKEVFVANPAVANAIVRSTRKLFVIGMEEGATSIFVMDADGRQIAALDVVIAKELKLGLLKQTLMQSFPDGRFDVRTAGDSVILSGTVASAGDAARAIDLANAFVGVSGGGGAPGGAGGGGMVTRGGVINNLTIRERDQVMLRVTVVEVARNVLKQFGVDVSGNWSNLNFTNSAPFSLAGEKFPAGNRLTGSVSGGGASISATLRAFEQAGVSRILAEPTLTAISGESAKFTAGGEIPVPQSQNCTTANTVSPAQVPTCIIGLVFKPYGVTLNFTPIVLSESRISVRVATDVTEIDPQNSYTFVNQGAGGGSQNTSVPGMTVRRSETTVELASGATMMTAGLIQTKSKAAINGLPGLINLPILGALFRSRDYQRQETELMIMVTPFIAKPMQPQQVARPDDGFLEANDGQGVLLGRLNKIYGSAGGYPAARGYRGHVGFITD